MIVHYKERKATKSYAILFLAVKLTTAEKTSCVLVSGYNIHTSIIEYSQLCNSSTPFKPLNDGILDYARALPDYDLRIVYVPKVHHTPKKAAELKKEYNIILEPYSRGDTDIWNRAIKIRSVLSELKNSQITNKSVAKHIARSNLVLTPRINNPTAALKRPQLNGVQPRGDRTFSTSTANSQIHWETYETDNTASNNIVERLVDGFWDDVAKPTFNNNNLVVAQLKAYSSTHGYRSLSNLETVSSNDRHSLLQGYSKRLERALNKYQIESFELLQIVYTPVSKTHAVPHMNTATSYDRAEGFTPSKPKRHNTDVLAPTSYNFLKWGRVVVAGSNKYKIKLTPGVFANVEQFRDGNRVEIVRVRFGEETILESFTDRRKIAGARYTLDRNSFARTKSDGTVLIYRQNKLAISLSEVKADFIEPLRPQSAPNMKILTMDLETRDIAGQLEPVCVSIYDGRAAINFWVADYKTNNPADSMIEHAFKHIMKRKYYGYKLYIHNLSYFDGVFLLRVLAGIPNIHVGVVRRDSRLIRLDIKFDRATKIVDGKEVPSQTSSGANYMGSISVFDSLLILPTSLDKLATNFQCSAKDMFPLRFLNEAPLNYVGDLPGIKYHFHPDPAHHRTAYLKFWDKLNAYNSTIKKSYWNLRDALVRYCNQDTKSLHEVLRLFFKEIHSRFGINPMKYPTLPAIAFAIFRKGYLKSNVIPKIGGTVYTDIKRAYYGGYVDVFKAFATALFSFDVNSLFPFMMFSKPVPVGVGHYFVGNILKVMPKPFGFFEVRVKTPDNTKLTHPILPQKHISADGSATTIYPYGTWTGWYFSEEIKNAQKFGYEFEVIRGYLYSESKPFSAYVKDLYEIKNQSAPGSPWYIISKLILNSLYGRFGMNPMMDHSVIMNNADFLAAQCSGQATITDFQPLGASKTLVTFAGETKDANIPNICVAVAAAITSWSRIHMTRFIKENAEDICYIDTDGIKLTKMLNPRDVGPELGKMKFEGAYQRGVFLAPKVYGLLVSDTESIVKVKGLKTAVSYWALEKLLVVESLVVQQFKWIRDWSTGCIKVIDQTYTLSATSNKRHIVRDCRGIITHFVPFVLHEGVKVFYHNPIAISVFPIVWPIITETPSDTSHLTFNTGTLVISCNNAVTLATYKPRKLRSIALISYTPKLSMIAHLSPILGVACVRIPD